MEPNMLKKIEELIEVIREKEEFRIEIIVTKDKLTEKWGEVNG